MLDHFKPIFFWLVGSLIALFRLVTLENLVFIAQLAAFVLTIAYTIWKWSKDKRRIKQQIHELKEYHNDRK